MFRVLAASASLLAALPAQAGDLSAVERIIADGRGLAAPGCAVGAFRSGEVLFTTAAGAGDVAEGVPLSADTLFYAASVSKQFTALAAALLAESGRLDLDQDVRLYLPELPEYDTPVTARMLMTHTAGIRDSLDLIRLAGIPRAADTDKETALRLVLGQSETNFTPGTAYAYSNGGYLLLAEIVARVSGMSFADFAKEAILEPLGMDRSHFLQDAPPENANVAHGYRPTRTGFEVRDTYPRFSGSGGLMTSVNDLARFEYDIEIGHRVWTPAIARTMTTPGRLSDGTPARDARNGLDYAGGLAIGQRNGQHVVQHGGSAETFKSMYLRLPERRLAVVLLCNRSDWIAQDKADAVVEAIEGDIFVDGPNPSSGTGRYVSEDLQAVYELSSADDGLNAQVSSVHTPRSQRRVKFQRQADGSYLWGGTRMRFDADGRGFTLSTSRIRDLRFNRRD